MRQSANVLILGLMLVLTLGGCSRENAEPVAKATPTEAATEATATPEAVEVAIEPTPEGTPLPTPHPAGEVDVSAIDWVTDMDEPLIGSPDAKRGGIIETELPSYPLTFRLFGPNSNDMFANWNRDWDHGSFGLVGRHPTTDNFIPVLATHWSVQDDNRTIYYKLDLDARWSDGVPITADDYIFASEFLRTDVIPLPFWNRYMEDYFQSVDKITDDIIRVVGKKPSWRPLSDYNFFPLPRHAMHVDAEWPVRENYTPPTVSGPYILTDWKEGQRVEFTRIKDWWGNNKRYFTGMYNVDKIIIKVIEDDDRAFDFFKKGELSFYSVRSARRWATEMDLPEIQKGYIHKKRVFTDTPQGLFGFHENLKAPIFQNKDFRKAIQYLVNFDELNEKIMYGAYYRMTSTFTGTIYANPDLKPYGFNPRLAREHLEKAGYTQRGNDGILQKPSGERASFTLIYSSKSFEPHLNVINNSFKRAGIEMKLQLLEGGAMFERGLEKAFEMILLGWTTGYYPDPHQYFSCQFADTKQNNNFFGFCDPKVDQLIDVYRFDMDPDARMEAMRQIDAIIHDEAMYVPFWNAPYTRFAYWHSLRWPENYLPRRASSILDAHVYWVDPARESELKSAMAAGKALPEDTVVDVDPYDVKARYETTTE